MSVHIWYIYIPISNHSISPMVSPSWIHLATTSALITNMFYICLHHQSTTNPCTPPVVLLTSMAWLHCFRRTSIPPSTATLPDSVSLPSARGTRQSPIYTRQRLCRVLHSAKSTRQKKSRQRRLCRVSFVGHSAKPLPSADTRQSWNRKKSRKKWKFLPKKNEIFF